MKTHEDQATEDQVTPYWCGPQIETLKIETHCSERRFGWQVPEFSGWNFGLR